MVLKKEKVMRKLALTLILFAAIISVYPVGSQAQSMTSSGVSAATSNAQTQKYQLAEMSTDSITDGEVTLTVQIGKVVAIGLPTPRPEDVEWIKKYEGNSIARKAMKNNFAGPMVLIGYTTTSSEKVTVREQLAMRQETHPGEMPLNPAPQSTDSSFVDVVAVSAQCPNGYRATVWQLIMVDGRAVSLLEIFTAPRSGVIEIYRLPLTESNLAEFRALQSRNNTVATR